jgi:hypothetical protein
MGRTLILLEDMAETMYHAEERDGAHQVGICEGLFHQYWEGLIKT